MERKNRKLANEICSVWCQADALYSKWAARNGINYFVLLALWVLYGNEAGMTQKSISHHYGWPKQTTNSVIRSLKQEGYVALIAEQADKREKRVILTEKGRCHAEKVLTPLFQLEDRVYGNIQKERLEDMVRTLQLFIILFEKELE